MFQGLVKMTLKMILKKLNGHGFADFVNNDARSKESKIVLLILWLFRFEQNRSLRFDWNGEDWGDYFNSAKVFWLVSCCICPDDRGRSAQYIGNNIYIYL